MFLDITTNLILDLVTDLILSDDPDILVNNLELENGFNYLLENDGFILLE